jgi:hypothetical protein
LLERPDSPETIDHEAAPGDGVGQANDDTPQSPGKPRTSDFAVNATRPSAPPSARTFFKLLPLLHPHSSRIAFLFL